MGQSVGMLWFLCVIIAVSAEAIQWDTPTPYDPVWFASVQTHAPVPTLNETRFWYWSWVSEQDVQFRLFTRKNPFEHQMLKTNDTSSLRNSHFNFDNKVKVLTHGWLNHVVDWGNAANVNYILASYNVAMVGRVLTEFLNFLINEGVSMDDVHLIDVPFTAVRCQDYDELYYEG
ncbi:unnamed protein product, partial [Leptidea sinapis]